MAFGKLGAMGRGFGTFGALGKAGSSGPSSYTGVLANNCMILEDKQSFGATSQMEAGSIHFARSPITAMSVAVPTWYVNHANGAETALGGTLTVNLNIEYPLGTVVGTFTWGGNSNPTLPDNSNNFSDLLTGLNIPKGGKFGLHLFCSGASGFVCNGGNDIGTPIIKQFARDVVNGEKYRKAASGLTMAATISAIPSSETNGQEGWRPAAIVGPTIQPSIFLLGDSRMMGYHDHYDDGSFDSGYARCFGANFAYINAGIFALTTGQYISSHALKNELAGYCSHIVFELGENDITNVAGSITTFLANQQTIFGYFPGKPIFLQTVTPATTSTNAWFDGAGQTSATKQANVATYNDMVRAGSIAGVNGYFEFADLAEGTRNSGIWNPSISPISAVFTASKSTTTLAVSAMTSGAIAVLDNVCGVGVTSGDQIAAFGTGVGQTGNYTVTKSQTVASETMFCNAPTTDGIHEGCKMYGLYRSGNVVNPAVIHR